MRKIQRDEPLEGAGVVQPMRHGSHRVRRPAVRVFLARNEYECAQLVIKSVAGDLSNVRLALGRLRRKTDGALFPASAVRLFRVGYVETYNLWHVEQCLGWWPDPLFPLKAGEAFHVARGENQPVLIQFHAPANIPAGEYLGELTVVADGLQPEVLTVSVTVFDFALPPEQHFTAAIPIWGGQMEAMYPGSMTAARKRAYLDMLLAYRLAPFPLDPEETEHAIRRGMRWFCVLCLPKDHVPENLSATVIGIAHLWQQRGWFGQATPYVLLGDEPNMAQWVYILQQGRLIRQVEPRLVRMNTLSFDALFAGSERPRDGTDAYIKSFDTLREAVDYFILATGCYPVERGTKLARTRGLKVWWYSVADVVYIPLAGEQVRLHFWKQWKYKVPGWLHWGMTYWGEENIRGRNGRKWPDVPWDTRSSRSGDGYLVYPGAGGKNFLPSLRLEIIRDGIEDYEYLWLLDTLTARLNTIKRTEGVARQLGVNTRLLSIDRVVRSYREAATDANSLLAARLQIAQAIEATGRWLR